ncbi:MAG: cell division protein FtsN [Candidatus Pseudothioglobus sp.]|jgi:cell division protein FtsN
MTTTILFDRPQMPQDFAKRHQNKAPEKSPAPSWLLFATGLITGLFSAFILFVWLYAPGDEEVALLIETPTSNTSEPTPKAAVTDWTFYEIFPKFEVPIVEEYGPDGEKQISKDTRAYVLQAGSFRKANDADKLRAELILLGMDVYLQVIEKDGQTWHRVMVGPIDSELELTRKRNLLAEASIETISLRINL